MKTWVKNEHEFDKLIGEKVWLVAIWDGREWAIKYVKLTDRRSLGLDSYIVYFKVMNVPGRQKLHHWLRSGTGDIPFNADKTGHFFTNFWLAWGYLQRVKHR